MNTQISRFARARTKRVAERAPVSIDASIVTMSAYQFPELIDISMSGARLKGSSLPQKGTSALLRAGTLEVLCRIVWVDEDECGIRFDEPVAPRTLKQVQLEGAIALEVTPCSTKSASTESP